MSTARRVVRTLSLGGAGAILVFAAVHGPAGASHLPLRPDTTTTRVVTTAPRPAARTSTAAAGATTRPGTAPATGAPATRTPAATGARQEAAQEAASYAQARGWRTGIAVVDLQTGEATTAGEAGALFPAESSVKVLLASRLLADGEMTGDVADAAHDMVAASDDGAADALYELAGGDDVVGWAAARYGIAALGAPPANGPGQWGSTQVTPLGMARFLAAAYGDPSVGPWLSAAMGAMEETAADGTPQVFGLRAVAPGAAVKQGWGGDVPGLDAETTPSIGVVDGRYAVAIYTLHEPWVEESLSRDVVTEQARLLLPGGHVPAR